MGFRDRLKNALGSDKKDKVDSQNIPNEKPAEKNVSAEASSKIANFRYLNDLIRSGPNEIVLDCDITFGNGDESDFANGIDIDIDGFVIDGNGHTIDADNKSRVFIASAKNITIKNVTFKNGFSNNGGAIYNRGELNIVDSTFRDNTARRYGGAIANAVGAKLNIRDSYLFDNKAQWQGGAVYNSDGAVISHCEIINNSGCAVCNYGSLTVDDDSTISDNPQGAILNLSDDVMANVNNCKFSSNKSVYGRGIIRVDAGEFNMGNCEISANDGGDGALIINSKGIVSMVKCEVSDNRASSIISNGDYMEIHTTSFRKNHAKNIIVNSDRDKSELSINYGEFEANVADEALVFNEGASCTVFKTDFKDDLSESPCRNIHNKSDLKLMNPDITGKSIWNEGEILIEEPEYDIESMIEGPGDVAVEKVEIPSQPKPDFGYLDSEIHKCDSKEFFLTEDICLGDYEYKFYEGGIELDIDGLVIDGGGKTIDGAGSSRIFIITAENVTLKNIKFKNGRVFANRRGILNVWGGAIQVNCKSTVNIIDCHFLDNSSEIDGGAILNSGDLTIADSTLSGGKNGAIHNFGKLRIFSCDFYNNESSKKGGILNNDGETTINDSDFYRNHANHRGYVIHNSGHLDIDDSRIYSNNGDRLNNAVFNGSEASIKNSFFTGNEIGCISNIFGKLNIMGSQFRENKANSITNGKGRVNVDDSKFLNNKATAMVNLGSKRDDNGGLVFDESTVMTVRDSTFSNNDVEAGGAAIRNLLSVMKVSDSTFTDNNAVKKGGAISRYEDSLEMEGCTFQNNAPEDVYSES